MGVKMCSKAMVSKKTKKRVARKNSKTLNVIKLNVNLGHPVGLIFGSIWLSIMARINTYVIYVTKLFIWNMEKIAISHICTEMWKHINVALKIAHTKQRQSCPSKLTVLNTLELRNTNVIYVI